MSNPNPNLRDRQVYTRDREYIREDQGDGAATGLIIGILLAALTGLAVWGYLASQRPSSETQTPSRTTVIERERTRVVPAPQQKAPDVNISVPSPKVPDVNISVPSPKVPDVNVTVPNPPEVKTTTPEASPNTAPSPAPAPEGNSGNSGAETAPANP